MTAPVRQSQCCGTLQILEKTAKHHSASQPGQSRGPTSNMFQHEEQVWSKGGQQLQEFWHGAEAHLKASKCSPKGLLISVCPALDATASHEHHNHTTYNLYFTFPSCLFCCVVEY